MTWWQLINTINRYLDHFNLVNPRIGDNFRNARIFPPIPHSWASNSGIIFEKKNNKKQKASAKKIHISWTISGHLPPIFSCTSFDIGFIQFLVLVPNWGFSLALKAKRQALQGCPRSRFCLPLLSKMICVLVGNSFFVRSPVQFPVLFCYYLESPHLLETSFFWHRKWEMKCGNF